MNAEHLSEAHHIAMQISELQRHKNTIETGGGLGVTIQSAYQDNTFVDAIRPHALAELDKRIQGMKDSLIKLGVTFSKV